MGEIVPLKLDVREDLDTANPITDRRPGVLVSAKDLHPRVWGPREGPKAFTRIWEGPGTAALYDQITWSGGASDGAYAQSSEDGFAKLGTKFTLDLWFRLEDIAYASAEDVIGLYTFHVASGAFVEVAVRGGNHADHEKVVAFIATSATPTTADATVTLTGATRIATGTAHTDKHHVRLVRDGINATLLLDGVSDGTTATLSATHGIAGRPGDIAYYQIGLISSVAGARFKGKTPAAILRDGAFTSAPIQTSMPVGCMTRGVHHYTLGRRYNLGGAVDHLLDIGPFALHPRVAGSPTYSSANDDTHPAPSSVQGIRSWTTRSGRTATAVMAGGVLSFATNS